MADQAMHAYQESTTHSERVTYVIEHPSSWRQHLSCDLNQVLSLRDSARPTPESPLIAQRKNRHKV